MNGGIPPPPQWDEKTGMDPNMFEQGVFSDEGVYGQGRMKMVGFSPDLGGGYGEGDPLQYGLQLGGGGGPLFEGKHGLMQCGINPQTGEYMKDASGKARCWYVPVIAGTHFTKGPGGWGTWVDTDSDIVHYQATLKGIGLVALAITMIPMILFFIWRISINKRMQRGKGPGLLAKLIHWDTWKLWGNKYPNGSSKVFAADDDYIDANAIELPPTHPPEPLQVCDVCKDKAEEEGEVYPTTG